MEESGSHWRSILVRVWCLLLYVCGPREERESRVNITQIIEEYTPPPPQFFYMIMGLNFDDIITVSDMLDNSEL